MKIQIITLFPGMFDGPFAESMLLKAQKQGLVDIQLINLREFGLGPRKTVDDTPYGGGDGMLLKPEPIAAAVELAKQTNPKARTILLSASGQTYAQAMAKRLSKCAGLILIAGHYEGVDERITSLIDLELSVGNYGGEIPAMLVVDSVVRLIPGVLGGETSAEVESFSDGQTVEYPQYTKPEVWNGLRVPKVLLSGNHQKIADWRREQALKKTKKRSARRHT